MSDEIAKLLFERFASFRHAAQLRDFTAYCREAAVLSRDRLSTSVPYYTRFYTDESDKKHGVWTRTFGNLQDYGSLFWFAERMIPNCYGPITVTFGRELWNQCDDIALTPTNPGDKEYNLDKDRLSPDAVGKCFARNGKHWKLTRHGLELSVGNMELPLSSATSVIIEPVNNHLYDIVVGLWRSVGLDSRIVRVRDRRNSTDMRLTTFHRLVKWATNAQADLPSFRELPSVVPNDLRNWFSTIRASHYPALRQWLVYTYQGTLSHFS